MTPGADIKRIYVFDGCLMTCLDQLPGSPTAINMAKAIPRQMCVSSIYTCSPSEYDQGVTVGFDMVDPLC